MFYDDDDEGNQSKTFWFDNKAAVYTIGLSVSWVLNSFWLKFKCK